MSHPFLDEIKNDLGDSSIEFKSLTTAIESFDMGDKQIAFDIVGNLDLSDEVKDQVKKYFRTNGSMKEQIQNSDEEDELIPPPAPTEIPDEAPLPPPIPQTEEVVLGDLEEILPEVSSEPATLDNVLNAITTEKEKENNTDAYENIFEEKSYFNEKIEDTLDLDDEIEEEENKSGNSAITFSLDNSSISGGEKEQEIKDISMITFNSPELKKAKKMFLALEVYARKAVASGTPSIIASAQRQLKHLRDEYPKYEDEAGFHITAIKNILSETQDERGEGVIPIDLDEVKIAEITVTPGMQITGESESYVVSEIKKEHGVIHILFVGNTHSGVYRLTEHDLESALTNDSLAADTFFTTFKVDSDGE